MKKKFLAVLLITAIVLGITPRAGMAQTTVSVACLTRMQDFIRTGNIKWHAFFNWVPGMLAKFDTESVVSLIAPRHYMQLMGDSDIGSPVEGVRYIQEKMEQVYALYSASDNVEFHFNFDLL